MPDGIAKQAATCRGAGWDGDDDCRDSAGSGTGPGHPDAETICFKTLGAKPQHKKTQEDGSI